MGFSSDQEPTMTKTLSLILAACVMSAGCDTDATIASRNLSRAADQFEVNRRVIFYNGINGDYMLSIEGLCSLDSMASASGISVTCKVGPSAYKKHFLGISDNVTFFVEQLEPVAVNTYHYRVIFKPQAILPDVDARGDVNQLTNH
jgi:hypothetical protein